MYFKNREEAGTKLVPKLSKYKTDNCAVVALTPGAVLVGSQISERLHANLMLILSENIKIPGEPEPFAGITSDNSITYNSFYSIGEIEEFDLDYYPYIEMERMNKLHNLHLLLGKTGEIKKDRLRHHHVILVSDGLNNGFSLSVATNYLKTINYKKLIVVSSFATPEAYDKMRLVADDAVCLNLVDNYLGVNHYYDDNAIPEIKDLLELSDNIAMRWRD
jgi:putative phosphoribosyl transferase